MRTGYAPFAATFATGMPSESWSLTDTSGAWHRPCTFGTCPRGRYRWVVLGAGTFAQASFSASTVGLPALGPALKSGYGLTLGETGVVLAAIGIGMLFTLLPWGLVADRVDERWVIATGLTGAAGALVASPRRPRASPRRDGRARRDGSARRERQRRERTRDHGVVPRLGTRPRARDPADRDPDRRRRSEPRSCPSSPRPVVRTLAFLFLAGVVRDRRSRRSVFVRGGAKTASRSSTTSPARSATRACGCSASAPASTSSPRSRSPASSSSSSTTSVTSPPAWLPMSRCDHVLAIGARDRRRD